MTAEPLLKLAARMLAKHRLDAVLIGNAAAALQGAPVTTMDLDFFMRASPRNVAKVRKIAQELKTSAVQPFYPASTLYRISKPDEGVQLDFMTTISGIRSFEGVRARASIAEFGGFSLHVAALEDVIRSKTAAGRPQDLAILPVLRRVVKERARHYRAQRKRNA